MKSSIEIKPNIRIMHIFIHQSEDGFE